MARIKPDEAAAELFKRIYDRAPHLLSELRATALTEDAIADWTSRHRLDSPLLRRKALAYAVWAAKNDGWRTGGIPWYYLHAEPAVVLIDGSQESKLRAALLRDVDRLLPAVNESKNAWRRRALEMYDRLAASRPPRPRIVARRPPETARHMGWFIDVHVLQQTPEEVARRDGFTRTAIAKAVKSVRELLGVPSNTPRGRRRKKM